MRKLFVITVGGYPPGSNLEVHDVRFHLAERLEDTFSQLKKDWWGGDDRFHVDAWGTLEWADGHDIVVAEERPAEAVDAALWFMHLGGYDPAFFGELHKIVFVVAGDKGEAKRRALAQAEDWVMPHRDVAVDIETTVKIDQQHVWLVPNPEEKPFRFEAKYLPKLDV